MEVDFNKVLTDVRDGDPLLVEKPIPDEYVLGQLGETIFSQHGRKVPKLEEVPMTLQYAAGEALGSVTQDDSGESQEEKLKRGRLLEKIYSKPKGEFTIEELALIKRRIGKYYGPIVVVAVENILETKGEG